MKRLKLKLTFLFMSVVLFAFPLHAFADTNYAFTYTFSTQIYTQSFDMLQNGGTIEIKLTSESVGTGNFNVTLQKCDVQVVTCNWTNVKVTTAQVNGASSAIWYGMSDGRYRFRFDSPSGYTIDGYGYYRYD